jgi:hypothetical protein
VTYERQRDLLREQVALATLEADDAKSEEIDIDGLIGFAEFILSNAARLWSESSHEQRQRLQRALFPEGLRFKDGGFGTAVTCLAFTRLQPISGQENALASPTGFEPSGQGLEIGGFLTAA